MEDPRLNNIYQHYESSFLTEKAKEWGWKGKKELMFIQRMLSSNNDLNHRELADVLDPEENFPRLGICAQSISEILSKPNNVYDRLEQLGLEERDLEPAQRFLRYEVFPEWVKPLLWDKIWKSAQPSERIEIQLESAKLTGGLLTAKPIVRLEDRSTIPKIPIGSDVNYFVPLEQGQHLILLEKDGDGGISCLSPSRVFPRFGIGEPVAREELLAIVSSQKPNLIWLEDARRAEMMELSASELHELIIWVESNRDCYLWQREFDVVT